MTAIRFAFLVGVNDRSSGSKIDKARKPFSEQMPLGWCGVQKGPMLGEEVLRDLQAEVVDVVEVAEQ